MKVRSLVIAFILGILFSQSGFAQTEKLGAIKYVAPKGFTKAAQEQHAVVFSVIDQAKGNFCFITLYAAGATSGNAQQDFASEWKTRVVEPWKAEANPKTESVPDNGWTGVAGGAPIEFQGNKAFAFLTVVSGFGKSVSVLGILNNESYLASLQAFLETMDIDKTNVSQPAPATTAPASGSASAPGAPRVDDYGHLIIPPPTRQLTLADVAGQWGENEGINIRYVDRYSGTYAGADSLHYRAKMTFTAGGEYYNDFYAIQNGKMIKEKSAGAVAINGRVLSIRSRSTAKYVIRGWLELPDMTILEVCGPWYDDDVIPQEIFNNPAQGANLDKKWVRKK